MYLKNSSESVCVIINTIVGKVAIKPGEVINLKEKILPPLSKRIVEVSEEEYRNFCTGQSTPKEPVEEVVTAPNTDLAQENSTMESEATMASEATMDVNAQQETINEFAKMGNQDIVDFVNQLFKKNMLATSHTDPQGIVEDTKDNVIYDEAKIIPPVEESLVVEQTTINKEKQDLEKTIHALEETWKAAKTAKKKEKLGKQIKELKKQLEKF